MAACICVAKGPSSSPPTQITQRRSGKPSTRDGGQVMTLTRVSLADGLGCEEEALSVLHLVGGASVRVAVRRVSICLRHFYWVLSARQWNSGGIRDMLWVGVVSGGGAQD